MDALPVVETLFDQFDYVRDGCGRFGWVGFNRERAFDGFEHDDGAGVALRVGRSGCQYGCRDGQIAQRHCLDTRVTPTCGQRSRIAHALQRG